MLFGNLLGKLRKPRDVALENSDPPPDVIEEKAPADFLSPPTVTASATTSSSDSQENLQDGIKDIQAVSSVWSRTHLIIAYIFVWLISFVDSMQQGMSTQLAPYVTSSFQQHSLTATTAIMSSLIGGISKIPLAKILDIWGRPHGFALMVGFLTIGLVMMAGCKNVETYAAAQVFYWIGYNGISYSINVFNADTSSLKNRALVFAFVSSPYIITAWIGGPLATRFLASAGGYRWGFGTFAIIQPVVCAPLLFLFWLNYRKAQQQGLLRREKSNRTTLQSIRHYLIEFDALGVLLLSGGLALFLLPFSIYSYQADGWHSSMIICMIVIGGLLVVAFGLYERFLSPKCFLPFHLLVDRTMLGACCLAAILFVSFFIWNAFFTSFLQVVQGVSITHAGYIESIYSVGSCFWSLVVGAAIRFSGRFKWVALYFGVPLNILAVGLLIHFRQPHMNIGFIVMCQIFLAFAGGACLIAEQMAVMAAVSQEYVAAVLAIEGMSSSIGGAIGQTIASAIWTGVFHRRLDQFLPGDVLQADKAMIYESLSKQLSYPVGSAVRTAIVRAYGEAQKYMTIAGTAVLVLGLAAAAVWKDHRVKDLEKAKRTVV